ncbi:MAG: 3-phosphoshikimate 1-carboxyvinyltransferase [Deltaproteobacteria bacterium]|nr:3-phosphoshikimate 1-carboxyvinyltransferase [Deltaproteobacteria bacterium]
MPPQTFARPARLHGQVPLLGDKSISHRALLFSALATGTTRVVGLSSGGDVASTSRCLAQLGVTIARDGEAVVVRGSRDWRSPDRDLDCGNSGTTMRLMLGALAGQPGLQARLVGDASLTRRPMRRVSEPLSRMGADIALSPAGTAPLTVRGRPLHGADLALAVASAQVKTAILLAGLRAQGPTRVAEPLPSRDHSERALRAMGAALQQVDGAWQIEPGELRPMGEWRIPGDPSSAAFAAVAALLHPNAELQVPQLCGNPTRLGWLRVLERMGGRCEAEDREPVAGEPTLCLRCRSSSLRATTVTAKEVPALIDEVPILAVAAAAAEGTTHFCEVGELRHKESDRLAETLALLKALGVEASSEGDDLVVCGRGAASHWSRAALAFDAGLDHRMAMSAAVAGLVGPAAVTVVDTQAIATSWPDFIPIFQGLAQS